MNYQNQVNVIKTLKHLITISLIMNLIILELKDQFHYLI